MRRQLEAAVRGVPVADGAADAIPASDASIDVVTVAQAFHWFETRSALDELARVLRPGGWLALVWHEPPSGGWAAEHWALRHRLTGFTGDYQGRGWEAVLDDAGQQRVLDGLAAFLAGHPDVAGRAELTYERPCTLHLCRRLG